MKAEPEGAPSGAGAAAAEPEQGPPLALALLDTLGPTRGAPGDRLRTPEELLAWLDEHGLGGDRLEGLAGSPAETALLLREAQRLRDDVGRALEAFRARRAVPPDALYGIDRILAEHCVSRRLRGEGARLRLEESVSSPSHAGLLAPVALSAAELVTSAEPRRVRRCAATDCGAWFLDTSKGGRRRWCSMATCGNRAKAARHRRRQRSG